MANAGGLIGVRFRSALLFSNRWIRMFHAKIAPRPAIAKPSVRQCRADQKGLIEETKDQYLDITTKELVGRYMTGRDSTPERVLRF